MRGGLPPTGKARGLLIDESLKKGEIPTSLIPTPEQAHISAEPEYFKPLSLSSVFSGMLGGDAMPTV